MLFICSTWARLFIHTCVCDRGAGLLAAGLISRRQQVKVYLYSALYGASRRTLAETIRLMDRAIRCISEYNGISEWDPHKGPSRWRPCCCCDMGPCAVSALFCCVDSFICLFVCLFCRQRQRLVDCHLSSAAVLLPDLSSHFSFTYHLLDMESFFCI